MDPLKLCEANVPLDSNNTSLESMPKEPPTKNEDLGAEEIVPMNLNDASEEPVPKDLTASNEELKSEGHSCCSAVPGEACDEPIDVVKRKTVFKCNCNIFPAEPGTLREVQELHPAVSDFISASFRAQSFEERDAFIMAYRDHLLHHGNHHHREVTPHSGRVREEDRPAYDFLRSQLIASSLEFNELKDRAREPGMHVSEEFYRKMAQLAKSIVGYSAACNAFYE